MKLTTETALHLQMVLMSLNTYAATEKAGEKMETVQRPAEFTPEVRAKIAEIIAQCTAVNKAYQAKLDVVRRQIGGGNPPEAPKELSPDASNDDKIARAAKSVVFSAMNEEFHRVNKIFLAQEHELPVPTIALADLNLGVNGFPLELVAHLAPIMPEWVVPKIEFEMPAIAVMPTAAPTGHARANGNAGGAVAH